MKRYVLTLIILAVALTTMAQATQPCLVLQYNQKQKKTPLGGVQVTVTNAGSTVSEADGRLTLSFRTLKPGAHVNFISAKKAGYEVFNSGAIKSWNISSEGTPFPIVLVRSDYFNQLKENLGKAPSETYEAQYKKAIRELEQQKLRDEEFQRRYNELEQKYHEQLAQLENYIDLFARIDLSEVSAEEERILDMVQQGKIDEALEAYEELGLLDKLETEAQAFQTLNDAAQQKKNNINELYEAVQRQVAVLIQANKKEEAEQKLLQLLATITPMYEISKEEYRYRMAKTQGLLGEVAAKWDDRHEFLEAALKEYTILYGQSPDLYLQDLSRTDSLLENWNKIAKREKYWLAKADHYTLLFKQDTLKYGRPLMDTQTQLGDVYKDQKDWTKAEKYYLTGLNLANLLAQLDPIQYFEELEPIQRTLARLYLEEVKDTVRAEKYMCMSVESRIQMFINKQGKNWGDFERSNRNLCNMIRHLIDFYVDDLKDFAKAEKYFLKQIERFTPLTEQEPRKYGDLLLFLRSDFFENYLSSKDPQYLAKQEEYELKYIETWKFLTQLDLDYWGTVLAKARYFDSYIKNSKSLVQIYLLQGETCLKLGDNEGAMKALKNLLDYLNSEQISETDLFCQLLNKRLIPKDLPEQWLWFGDIYFDIEYRTAEHYYLLALEHYTQLFSQDSNAYREKLAEIQYKLANLYDSRAKDFTKAEEYYLMALEHYTQLFAQDSNAYGRYLEETQHRLEDLYHFKLKDYTKAEDIYLKELENSIQLYNQDSSSYNCSKLARTQYKLGNLYNYDLKDYTKAEEYYLKALENRIQLFSEKPDTYREDLASSYNQLAYLYAHQNNFAKALETIDKAIELMPEDADYYDTKGEILLMKGDEQEAVKMWQKVLELDPDFLKKHEDGTDFYKQLKEKGLIND